MALLAAVALAAFGCGGNRRPGASPNDASPMPPGVDGATPPVVAAPATCGAVDCAAHGTCSAQGGGAVCTCDAGYVGAACDECASGAAPAPDGTCAVKNPRVEFTSVPWERAEVGRPYTYDADAFAYNVDPAAKVVFELVDGPATMTIDAATGELSWLPGAGDVGSHPITLKATAGALTAEQSFNLQVDAATVVATQTVTAAAGGTITVAGTGTGLDGMQVTFAAGALPADTDVSVVQIDGPVPDTWQPGLTQVTPTFRIEPAVAQAVATVTVPMSTAPGSKPVVLGFYRFAGAPSATPATCSSKGVFSVKKATVVGSDNKTLSTDIDLTAKYLAGMIVTACVDDTDPNFRVYWLIDDQTTCPDYAAKMTTLASTLDDVRSKYDGLGCEAATAGAKLPVFVATIAYQDQNTKECQSPQGIAVPGLEGKTLKEPTIALQTSTLLAQGFDAADHATGALRDLLGHEYFHIEQFHYNVYDPVWFREATASYMPTVIYPSDHWWWSNFGGDQGQYWDASVSECGLSGVTKDKCSERVNEYRQLAFFLFLEKRLGKLNVCDLLAKDRAGNKRMQWPRADALGAVDDYLSGDLHDAYADYIQAYNLKQASAFAQGDVLFQQGRGGVVHKSEVVPAAGAGGEFDYRSGGETFQVSGTGVSSFELISDATFPGLKSVATTMVATGESPSDPSSAQEVNRTKPQQTRLFIHNWDFSKNLFVTLANTDFTWRSNDQDSFAPQIPRANLIVKAQPWGGFSFYSDNSGFKRNKVTQTILGTWVSDTSAVYEAGNVRWQGDASVGGVSLSYDGGRAKSWHTWRRVYNTTGFGPPYYDSAEFSWKGEPGIYIGGRQIASGFFDGAGVYRHSSGQLYLIAIQDVITDTGQNYTRVLRAPLDENKLTVPDSKIADWEEIGRLTYPDPFYDAATGVSDVTAGNTVSYWAVRPDGKEAQTVKWMANPYGGLSGHRYKLTINDDTATFTDLGQSDIVIKKTTTTTNSANPENWSGTSGDVTVGKKVDITETGTGSTAVAVDYAPDGTVMVAKLVVDYSRTSSSDFTEDYQPSTDSLGSGGCTGSGSASIDIAADITWPGGTIPIDHRKASVTSSSCDAVTTPYTDQVTNTLGFLDLNQGLYMGDFVNAKTDHIVFGDGSAQHVAKDVGGGNNMSLAAAGGFCSDNASCPQVNGTSTQTTSSGDQWLSKFYQLDVNSEGAYVWNMGKDEHGNLGFFYSERSGPNSPPTYTMVYLAGQTIKTLIGDTVDAVVPWLTVLN